MWFINILVKVNQNNNIISTFMWHQELFHMLYWTYWKRSTVVLLWPPEPAWPGPASPPNLSSHQTCSRCSGPQPRSPFVTSRAVSWQLPPLPTKPSPTSTLSTSLPLPLPHPLHVTSSRTYSKLPSPGQVPLHIISQITVVMLWLVQWPWPASCLCPTCKLQWGRDISVLFTILFPAPSTWLDT